MTNNDILEKNHNNDNLEGELKEFLLDSEEILWSRSEIINLMRISPWLFILALISCIIVSFLILSSSLIEILFYLSITGTFVGIIIILIVKEFNRRIRILKSSRNELKNYLCYDILTNKRYIRRNYAQNFGKDIDFSDYPSKALFFNDDKLILDLSYIEVIYVNRIQQDFCFWVRKTYTDEFATNLNLKYFDHSEYGKIVDTLSNIMHLDIFDQGPRFIEFHTQKYMEEPKTRIDKENLEAKLEETIQDFVKKRRKRNFIIIFSIALSIPFILLMINMFWALHLAQIEASSSLREKASIWFMIFISLLFIIGIVFYFIDKKFGFTLEKEH